MGKPDVCDVYEVCAYRVFHDVHCQVHHERVYDNVNDHFYYGCDNDYESSSCGHEDHDADCHEP